MDNLSIYSSLVSQAQGEEESEFQEKAQQEEQKVQEQETRNSDIEGIIAPFGAEAIKQAGGRIAGAGLRKLGLKGTADFVEDASKNPVKAVGQLYKKTTQEATSRVRNTVRGVIDRIRQGGEEQSEGLDVVNRIPQLPKPSTLAQAQASRPEPEVPKVVSKGLEEPTASAPEPEVPEAENPFSFKSFLRKNKISSEAPSETPLSTPRATEVDPFSTSSRYSDIVDDIVSGKSSMLDGVIKGSLRAPTKALAPRISELQGNLTQLKPADVPSSIDGQTVRGLSSRVRQEAVNRTQQAGQNVDRPTPPNQNQIQTQPREQPEPTEPSVAGQEPTPSGEGNIADEIQSGRANITNEGSVNQATRDVSKDVEKKVAGKFEDGVDQALVENSADLENPVGDVIELGLGIASLVGSLWGTKVHHADVASQVANVNPSLGFGIKAE